MSTPTKSPIIASAGMILGPDGNPYRLEDTVRTGSPSVSKVAAPGFDDNRLMLSNYASYVAGVYGLQASALSRALEPFTTHAWVFAGAMAVARNLSQAPFTLYQETKDTLDKRAAVAKSNARPWYGGRSGRSRTALQRHLSQTKRFSGQVMKGLQEDPDSPYQTIFNKPNFLMSSDQFWTAHWLWMMLRGECFWVMTTESGAPIEPGEVPDEIFPMSPDLFRAVYDQNVIVAWQMRVPLGLGGVQGHIVTYLPQEIIPFRYFNPRDMMRGLSPLSSAAGPINLDLKLLDAETSLINNGSQPTGVIMVDKDYEFPNQEARNRFYKSWEQRHQSEKGRGRIAVLEGMKYVPTGLSPHEMQGLETRQWDREEILGVLGVPKTAVGVTENVNKATAKVIDKSFWDKTLIPIARNTEATLDSTLFYMEADSVVGGFDFTRVESLKEAVEDQIKAAQELSGLELHVPPKIAMDMVGLQPPDYEGDMEVVVASMNTTMSAILILAKDPQPPTDPNAPADPAGEDQPDSPSPSDPGKVNPDNPATPDATPGTGSKSIIRRLTRAAVIRKKNSTWRAIVKKVQQPAEAQFGNAWKAYITKEKQIGLHRFDEVTSRKRTLRFWNAKVKADDFDVSAILQDITGMKNRLKKQTVQAYDNEHKAVYDFTIEELGGIPVFHIDDPQLVKVMESRQDLLVGSAPATLQNRLRESVTKGIQDGETIGQLRDRVASVYSINASSAKTLMIARTESANTMNALRDSIFDAQGIDTSEWTTAEDEHVRETHVVYGNAGPQPRDFNYLTLTDRGDDGSLTFAGDPDAPADEVINCRCCMISGDSQIEDD